MQRQSTHKFAKNLPTVIHISRFTISCYNHKLNNLLKSNVLILYIQTNCNIVYTVINHPILRMTTTQKGKKIIDDNEKKISVCFRPYIAVLFFTFREVG